MEIFIFPISIIDIYSPYFITKPNKVRIPTPFSYFNFWWQILLESVGSSHPLFPESRSGKGNTESKRLTPRSSK